MREIQFRGKLTCNKDQFVYGYLIVDQSGNYYIVNNFGGSYTWDEVIPKTVGQLTDNYDKNGNNIWEDDIIQYQKNSKWGFHCAGGGYKDNDIEIYKGVIEFQDGAFRIARSFSYPGIKELSIISTRWKEEFQRCILDHCQVHRDRIGGYDNAIYSEFEVIGNIYDNPELLSS